jgi:hypothetical protein
MGGVSFKSFLQREKSELPWFPFHVAPATVAAAQHSGFNRRNFSALQALHLPSYWAFAPQKPRQLFQKAPAVQYGARNEFFVDP